jgi:hypothetical protein
MYMISPSRAYYLDERTIAIGGGNVYAQSSAVTTNAAWAGSYATRQFGYFIVAVGILPGNSTSVSGQISADGNGTLAGTLDINDPSGVFPGLTLQGTYSVGSVAPGRTTVSITTSEGTRNYIAYVVSPTQVLLLDVGQQPHRRRQCHPAVLRRAAASRFALAMKQPIRIIGAGLAGSEAAWQCARRGIAVQLFEMRPASSTPAHQTANFAELVCSNSLKSDTENTAPWLLKEEMRRAGSLLMEIAQRLPFPPVTRSPSIVKSLPKPLQQRLKASRSSRLSARK